MNLRKTLVRPFAFALVLLSLAGCPKKTADLELSDAEKAIADARANKATDCAQETFQAAEDAIAEAKALAASGEIEKAKARALEAKTLAEQASAAARPGCVEEAKQAEAQKTPVDTENASRDLNVNLDQALETIYFDYNDATIREDGKKVLAQVAEALRATPGTAIEIEGHCDVRGSTEYNLHLGERRARAVEKYLTTLDVNPKQLQIISYGEERPVDLGDTEVAHQKNRRAELKKLK